MSEYKFREWTISEHMVESIKLYVSKGIEPGHFLSAVICNDLVQAVMYADGTNIRNLPAFGAYLYNAVPSNAWGSEAKMRSWMERGGSDNITGWED